MLPSESYKVKIIHYQNPYLIWVERDYNCFEQIGLYGIIPHSKTLGFNPENNSYGFVEKEVKEWLPAAMNLMKEFLDGATEIWFSGIYLDDGAIFNEGEHKYGDIYKTENGEVKKLSDHLLKTSFAIKNTSIFLERLNQKLFTKLNYPNLKDILKKLKMYYSKTEMAKKLENTGNDLVKYYQNHDGDLLDAMNLKYSDFSTQKTNNVMDNFKKMPVNEEKQPKNFIMLKKLENFKMLMKKIEANKSCGSSDTSSNAPKEPKEPKETTEDTDTNSNKQMKLKKIKESAAKTQNQGSSDELEDLMEYINTKYPKSNKVEIVEKKDTLDIKNISRPMCTFVEKMIKPVVMVHSKFNNKIKTEFHMRDIAFNEHIHIVLKKLSVYQPMTMQSISWHTILRGYSVFMIGPKSSGKTMGYLPCVCRLVSDGTEIDSAGPIAIIVCATSESVAQVEKHAKMLVGLNDRVVACYPGVDDMFITSSLLNGCEMLISTPSMLVRLLNDSNFGVDLRRFRVFVLDDCERLDEVFKKEIKFFHYKINEIEKIRESKEYKVQYILASRIWCGFMESLAKKVPNTVVSIGAFPECVIYSKAKMSVSFVKKSDKVSSLIEFLDEIDASKKIVIVCRYNDDVKLLETELKRRKNGIFVCHNDMTLSDLHRLNTVWNDYDVPLIGPILICTDDNLAHLNITDGNYLVHFSLPEAYSFFRKRFFVLNDKYSSIFYPNNEIVKVKIILEETDTEKLPKILNFIKRCTDVPQELDELCKKVLAAKDVKKAETFVPICGSLLTLGYCPEFYDCQNRHSVLKHDEPPTWMPRSGIVTFKIVHFHTATNYSAHLLSHIDGKEIKFRQMYALSIKLGMYFGNTSNRQLHGIPKVGDVCAVSIEQHSFARCQIVKIIGKTHKGSYRVLVKLIDEEKYTETRDIYLYYLPNDLASEETYTVQIRLANVQPKDNDVTFSALALEHMKKLVEDEYSHVRGRIVGLIGKCLFVDTLEVCEDLSSLDQVVVKHDLKEELLSRHAEEYPGHMDKIKELCGDNDFYTVKPLKERKKSTQKNTGRWAHLNIGELEGVHVMAVDNPEKCLIRISKFESCMQILLRDIQKYIESEPKTLTEVKEGDILLAKYPHDHTYERARVEKVDSTMIKCLFVDQGDCAYIPLKDLMPISDKLIDQLPFQSIECRLIGVKPPGTMWTDFCINWLSDYVDEGTKHFYAKAFTKQSAEITGGNKYSIALVDTSSSSDVIINQRMIDLNFALELEDEIHFFDDVIPKNDRNTPQDDWERVSSPEVDSPKVDAPKVDLPKVTEVLPSPFLPPPIRSVPLVGSDCESNASDPWEIYNMAEFTAHINPFKKPNQDKPNPIRNLPALMPNTEITRDVNSNKFKTEKPNRPRDVSAITEALNISQSDHDTTRSSESLFKCLEDLDSDDTMTSYTKSQIKIIDETRKPKLLWRQTRTDVNIKIQLIDVEKYDMLIEERYISFSTFVHETKYSFGFELYGVINKAQSSHSNKGQYILVKMKKVLQKKWSTLTKEPLIKRWIAYDNDHLDTSSDEELVDDSILKIVKQIREQEENDSDDDDDEIDDVTYKYK